MTMQLPNVSRETQDRLEGYAALIRKWNPKINLVSKSSIETLWERHILDSVQVFQLSDAKGHWLDIGSGGGFPGMVVAILNMEERSFRVSLVESDQRKCAFLRTVARELDIEAEVFNERIEQLEPQNADVLSARALSSLTQLMEFSVRHLNPTGLALFPKGGSWRAEEEEARKNWDFALQAVPSKTNPEAAVLMIKDIVRA
ncbi:16S rRNA (guanine(527)-N(7))-methyltransferase RsmG [Sulfitobacter sp. PS-8MA]|uniref:16S rRNA (guanine(527)-N(7))-methyltransferase RsmG n=1 Tax=Sulfitobacter sp. PS-8MA TaxID=3237707 RepID=UPI0034C67796